jgi:hypothetical protein
MKIFEKEGGEKPFRKSKGRQKEQDRVVFDPQENDEDKSDAHASFEPVLDLETEDSKVVQSQVLPPMKESEIVVENLAETQALQSVASEESKPVMIEKQEPVASKTKARVEKGERTAIDKQIASMKRELKKFEVSSKQFDRIATLDQKENRAKEIEALKRGIEDAEKKKAELEAAKNERAKKAQRERDKAHAKVSERKKALEDKSKVTGKEFTEKDAETLLNAVLGEEKPETAVVETQADAQVGKGERTVIDKQILAMQAQLKKLEASSGRFKREATPKQRVEREKLIEELKQGIRDAEKAKLEVVKKDNLKKKNINDPSSGLVPEEETEYRTKLEGRQKQTEPKKNGYGVKQESGLLPEEEAEHLVKLKKRKKKEKRLAKAAAKKPPAGPVVAPQAEVIIPAVEVPNERERQLNLPIETLPNGPDWGVASEESKQLEREKLFDKISRLNEEVAEAREQYVKEDYENTKIWKKLTSFFRIQDDEKKGEWRALYEAKTLELQKAELEMKYGRETGVLANRNIQEETVGLLRYYKLDEQINLVNERTQYRAKNLTFGEKIGDSFGALGRWYNRIPRKQQMIIAGVLGGIALAMPPVGGALGLTVYTTMAARRWAAGAGLSIVAEAGLEEWGKKRRTKQTEKEIEELFGSFERGIPDTEQGFSRLEKILEQDVLSLDSKLQHEKRAKTYRKLAATTLGVAVGSGWLAQIIMDKLGGREALESVKAHFISGAPITEDLTLPKMAGTSAVLPDAVQIKTNLIHDFVNQDIAVQKGDSVWKISGRLADNLGLDGAERTHFIDAMKDKFGDVPLQTGEQINFSSHGINDDFVKNALEDSRALSPDKAAQILANNTRLEAFMEANPNVRLTDELTKNILEGKTPKVSEFRFGPQVDLDYKPAAVISSSETTAPGFRFGHHIDTEYQPTPESVSSEAIASEYSARADGWYNQIFKSENVQFGDRVLGRDVVESLKLRDVIHDAQLFKQGAAGGYTTGLNQQEINNFLKFDENISKSQISFDRLAFWRENPNATVFDYLKKIASLTRRGQRIGSYTTL